MARGWESKSVEAQQAEALERTAQKARLSKEEVELERLRQGLELQRQRVLQELEKSLAPSHRGMLQAALADLDLQLESMGRSIP